MSVVLGQTSEDELLRFFLGLLIVTAKRVDAVRSGLSGHQCREEEHAADGESVEQSRGADWIESHEDVTLLDGGSVDDAAEDVLLQQRRSAIGCLKLLLAHVREGAERFLTGLKLLTVDAGEKSALSRESSCRESCHFLSIFVITPDVAVADLINICNNKQYQYKYSAKNDR